VEDARAIAAVHVEGWQWAYRGLLPDDLLDNLSVDGKTASWTRRLADEPLDQRVWVACLHGSTVGFADTGEARDARGQAQLRAIYVRADAAGRGIGCALMLQVLGDLERRDYRSAMLWVYADNVRARRFYERFGWTESGLSKFVSRGSVTLRELGYRIALRGRSDVR
jgi:ribosomal protein S18 acetylase RimI-like enzyme